MFKKLKEKITEEVKISPQRFAEFTQSVSDRLQNNTNPDENLFSIGEDDVNSSISINNLGFSSVSLVSPSQEDRPRRNSNASVASDISFLPRYEATSMYHIQSDLDISASEIEDNVSNASSQLGHLSKEQIHSAFQKSQMRYHKYRGRFTDLARHYKDLERENAKMKAILVETQDKAIRRVQELKEQCNLEQKAKAHLESALRDEIDERNYKIKTLETKIALLKTENNSEQLISIENDNELQTEKMENLTKYLTDARKEIETLNEKLQEMKANAIIFQSREQDYKTKIATFEKEISGIAEREKENNLKLAQSKMELHNEMLMKDTEISNLKRENEALKQNLNAIDFGKKNNENMKFENLQSQNKKLIDKIELLTQKSNALEKEALKVESCKIEIENLTQEILGLKCINKQQLIEKETLLNNLSESEKKYQELTDKYEKLDKSIVTERKELEDQITILRDEAKKGLLSLEPKIREKIQTQFAKKEVELKREFENKIEEFSSNKVGIKEIKLQLLLKDNLIKNMSEELESLKKELSKKTNSYHRLENDHLELINDSTKLRNTISNLEKEKISLESYEEKIPRLEAHIKTLQEELKEFQNLVEQKEAESIQLNVKIVELQNALQKNDNAQISRRAEEEIRKLSETLKQSSDDLQNSRERLKIEQENSLQLNENRLHLENEVDRLKECVRIFTEKDEETNSVKSEYKLLKSNLQKLEEEREILTKDLFDVKRSLLGTEQLIIRSTDTTPNEIVIDIMKLNEAKENTLNMLNEKNSELLQELNKITEEYRLTEEKLETTQEENSKLVQEFEVQLKELNELIENSKKMQEKERIIDEFEEKLNKSNEEKNKLNDNITSLEIVYTKLQDEKLELENTISKLQEKVHILEEKEQAIDLHKTEYYILQIKCHKLEEELKILLDSFEIERASFNEAFENLSKKEEEIKQLTEENSKMKHSITKYEEELANIKLLLDSKDKLCENIRIDAENKIKEHQLQTERTVTSLNESKSENAAFHIKITEVSEINDRLKKELHEKDSEIMELTNNILKLSETLEERYIENKNLQEQIGKLDANSKHIETQITETAITEKRQFLEKINECNSEIELKTKELNQLNKQLGNLETLYTEQISNNETIKQEVFSLQNKICSLQNEEEKHSHEIFRLKNALKEKDESLERYNQMDTDLEKKEYRLQSVIEENHKLVEENIKLQENYGKMKDLKNKNDMLQRHLDTSKNEISELKIRCQQITSDYQNMLHENQILTEVKEQLEIKIQKIENFNVHDDSHTNMIAENQALTKKIEETNNQLKYVQQQNLDLIAQIKESSSNELDIVNIQRDFFEIKEKCDSLFVENKNLTQEYAKLEEKCNKFRETKDKMQNQISELEKQCTEILHEKQLIQDEIQELKTLPLNFNNNSSTKLDQLEILKQEQLLSAIDNEKEAFKKEVEILRDKITKYKSLDLTNKSSIEFYENELQKVKNQNDKLNRKLDETLVTLQHCAELSTSTEVEYLKNVLYNYMLGKESLVLARVIAAVCKFDPHQTDLILQREQQKQTLLGQFGFI